MVSKIDLFCNQYSWRKPGRKYQASRRTGEQTKQGGKQGNEAQTDLLGAVAGVDPHVFRGEITSPVARRSASGVQIEENVDIFFEQAIARRALVERQGLPAAQYRNAGHVNVHSAGIELDAGAPGGGENAPPVGVASGESGLYQRRSGDGLADAARVRFFFGATDFDFNHPLRAFAVRDDLQRERRANLFEGSPK